MASTTLPTFFISHGGGPWPWMKDSMQGRYDQLAAALQRMPDLVGTKPKAVLMISAHWEEDAFTVMAHPNPPMVYDYYGFPEYTYQIKYAAPGAPALAERVRTLLSGAGIESRVDPARGFDHGMYAPMAVIYPNADMPTVQLSLKRGLDPAGHVAMGRAIAPLRDDGVLIIGSGLSYHNLRAFGPAGRAASAAFDAWLQRVLASEPVQRVAALTDWEHAPAARAAHPREEHLLPLMAAVGAAGNDTATRVYHEADFSGGITVSSFMFDRRTLVAST
jgi:aromatic ring-opening dioxygenase catalytic subunit (LigB family)